MAWCGAEGQAAAGRHVSLPSHHFKLNPLYRNLCIFFSSVNTIFALYYLHGSPPPFLRHPVRERGRVSLVTLFSLLFSLFHSSSSSSSPLFLSATLNSPSLIQLSGRRDSACSERFTPHGPASHLEHLYNGRCGSACVDI